MPAVQQSLDINALAILGVLPVAEDRNFHPDQLRIPGGAHGGGEWTKGGGAGALAKDTLHLADRIQLEPGERLVSSDRIEGDGLDLNFAVIHSPHGNQVRIGLIPHDDSDKWRAADKGGTAVLEESDVQDLRKYLTEDSAKAKKRAAEADKAWNSGHAPTDPVLLGTEPVAEDRIYGDWANIFYSVYLTDDEPVGWQTTLRIGAGDTPPDEDGISFDPKELAALLKKLAAIQDDLGDTSTPSRSTPSRGGLVDARADKPYGDVQYADPGLQPDGKARYPIDSEAHCKAAWSYVSMPKNAAMYTAGQLARIKARIKTAAKKYGIDISDDSGRSLEPVEDRYNDQHAPAGSATGGQFTTGGSGGGSGKQHGHAKPKRPTHRPSGAHHDSGTLAYDPHSNQGTGYDSKQGDERVHALQQALNRLGVTDAAGKKLRDDGQLGPKTTSAVKKLQQLLGVKPDGKVTPALLAQIKAMKSLPAQKRSDAMGICLRSFGFELDERSAGGDGRTLEGYAAVFNSPTTIRDLNGDFEETILPGAFKRTLGERTPILQWDHGKDPRIGTAPIGDIQDLREDDHGLYVRARLYDHPDIERIRMAIAGRSVKGMSFRFGVPKGGDDWPTRDQRQIRDLDAYELGPVAFPAYDTTSVTVRSLLAQLDPDEHRSLIRELAAELRLAVDLSDLTGASDARSADRGDFDLQPGSGGGSRTSIEIRRLEAEALHALGAL